MTGAIVKYSTYLPLETLREQATLDFKTFLVNWKYTFKPVGYFNSLALSREKINAIVL